MPEILSSKKLLNLDNSIRNKSVRLNKSNDNFVIS